MFRDSKNARLKSFQNKDLEFSIGLDAGPGHRAGPNGPRGGLVDPSGPYLQTGGFYKADCRSDRLQVSLKLTVMATEAMRGLVRIGRNLEGILILTTGRVRGSGLANPGSREIAWGTV
jgi:hypothetical protein